MIPAASPALVVAAGLAGAAVGAVSPALARVALAGGRRPDGLDARPLDPLPGLGRAAAVVAALVTAILAALVVAETPPARIPLALLLVAVGPALVLADLAAHRLPDRATAPAAVAAAALALVSGGSPLLLQAAACGAGAVLVLALLQAATGGGLGTGDVKLAGVIGLALGQLGPAQVALAIAASTLLGGVAATALLVGGRARASTAVPFGPWLVLGALLVASAPSTLT
ncbi:prepilin peptidase [Clavibacter michiganensis]|uniref:Prepilin signalpeptidase n=2 Tax=Clavibacter michiganensis subsp. insidiosus TaxID=33014 RepID=A0A0D5CKI9_9MICO|nr:prepilin peptidase [Clavibacter michiganensis]AJW80156.1 prepilin signalpeptidase [Clavibacter michiganensis subsp. insidiosus]AWF97177.1 prepilin signalpeptidase [Clavibacter michiganensis subsp. insidiosus]AWG02735.1 prepilin signalpeptidase [Clavibacter michiganensis subsp. insidiosus]OQJ58848.1 prepilin signalpeptidase [Clavibacter michiganensis subsp. insidiosus]RMC85502.1 prepilin signalpeptidase [Clavibacter michiganensis subsp. insidiosus]